MTTETQADFGRRIGVGRSRVHALKEAGRLVMEGDLVNVEPSLERLESTRNSAHDNQAIAKVGPGRTAPVEESAAPRRIDAQARKEHAQADIAEMERDKMRGELLRKDDVIAAVADIVTTLRVRLESLPAQLGAQVAPISDEGICTAMIADNIEAALAELSHQAGRVAE
jgi:phage terminase Nu1 subunit (DNA packaging protein)